MTATASRPLSAPSSTLEFGPYRLDRAQARLTREGHPLALVGRPFELLCVLAERAQTLVEKDDLLDAVWGHRHVTESSLKGAINTLRLALGDDAKMPRYVETVPRRGYRFIAEVRESAPELDGDAKVEDSQTFEPEPLVGRTRELEALQALLQRQRLVTLTGLGGIGKTRLALAAATRAEGPVWLLRLDELSDPERLVPTLAQRLELGDAAAGSLAALGRALQRERGLLVLDNAEHLLDAVANLCAALLSQAPQIRLLVTSQAPLRLGAEAVLPLGPLELPPADAGIDPEAFEATQLLVARIRHHTPGWEAGPHDAEALVALCRALDGLPLALELAAARVPLLGLAGVRSRLERSLALLNLGARDGAERHRSLWAALDWTLGLLSEGERSALQQLAVIAGTFSVETCEGVLGPEALDQIEELRARALLVVVHGETGLRLRMFETVRSHALHALRESGREAAARRAHLEWLLRDYEPFWLLDLTSAQETWQPARAADLDALRCALRHALAPAAPAELRALGLRLALACSPLWLRSGYPAEGVHWLRQAQALLGPEDRQLRLWLELALVDYCAVTMQGDARAAADSVQALLAEPALQADPLMRFLALRSDFWLKVRLGFADREQGPRQECDAFRAASLPEWPELSQRWWMRAEANVARLAGDYEGVLTWADRHGALCRRHGALASARALSYQSLQMLGLLDRWDEACVQARAQLSDIVAAGAIRQYPFVLATASAVLMRSGPLGADREDVLLSLRLMCDLQQLWWLADALPWLAWHAGRPGDALALQHWADGLVHQRKEKRGPFFGGMREALRLQLAAVLGPDLEADEVRLVEAAGWRPDQVLDLALGAGSAAALFDSTRAGGQPERRGAPRLVRP